MNVESRACRFVLLLVTFCTAHLSGCGGGGGGNSTPQALTISGTVTSPGGQVAFDPSTSLATQLAATLIPSAHAAGSNAAVADGTLVEMARVDGAGQITSTLAQTATANGRYQFNLSELGVGFSADLIVQVRNAATGARLRAIAAAKQVDISPASEAAVQILFEKLRQSGAAVGNITATEATDLQESIEALAVRFAVSAPDLASHVQAVKDKSAAEPALQAYLSEVAAPGQAAGSPGDVGNYFPLEGPSVHRYVTIDGTGGPTQLDLQTYVLGTRNVAGRLTFESVSSSGDKEYLTKDSTGVYLVAAEERSSQLSVLPQPVALLRFPLRRDVPEVLFRRESSVPDIDGDNLAEQEQLSIEATVVALETLTVAGKTIPRCARVVTTATARITVSTTREVATATSEDTSWYAPGIGIVRERLTESQTFRKQTSTASHEIELGGVGLVASVPVGAQDLAYDAARRRLYASLALGQGAIQSGLAVINPESAAVERVVPITAGAPKRLALSADASVLYVSVDAAAEGFVQKYNTGSLTLLSQFSLGRNSFAPPPDDAYFAADMEVNPQNADLLAVSRRAGIPGQPLRLYLEGKEMPAVPYFPFGAQDISFTADGSQLRVDALTGLDVLLPGLLGRTRSFPVQLPINPIFNAPGGAEMDNSMFVRNGRLHAAGYVADLTSGVATPFKMGVDPLTVFDVVRPLIEPDVSRDAFFLFAKNQLRFFDGATATQIGVPLDFTQLGWQPVDGAFPLSTVPLRMVRYGRDALAIAGIDGQIKLLRVPLWAEGETTPPVVPPSAFKAEVKSLSLTATYLTADARNGLLYAAVRGAFGGPGSIAVIDPITATVRRSISVTSEPSVLALSDDGNVLYAALNSEGVVQRIDLATSTPTLRIPIGDPLCTLRSVVDIEVVPGKPQAIVVATGPDLLSPCTPFEGRIDVYDNATRRANSVVSTFINAGQAIEFGENASTLYASELVSFLPELRDLRVDQSGVIQTNSLKGSTYLENFEYLEGKLFGSQGTVLDARTKNVIASFQSAFGTPSALIVDPAKRRAYTLFHDSSEYANVGLFDADSAATLDLLQVPAGDGIGFPAAGDLVLLGNSHFAFRSSRSFGKEQVHVLKILQ